MRISLIGPVYPYRGGIAHFTTMLAKKLIEEGHDVQVISFKKQYPAWLYPGKSDKDTSPGRIKVPADYLLAPFNPITWIKTVSGIRKFNPDKVILQWWVTIWGPAFGFIIRKLKGTETKTSVLIYDITPHERHFLDKKISQSSLRNADQFITLTEKGRSHLLKLIPKAENVNTVPLPIFKVVEKTSLDKHEARKQLLLPTDKPIMLFFGFIRPYKGLSVLLDSLEIIISQGQEMHLVIAGEFWENPREYESQIISKGLTNYVHVFNRYIPDSEVGKFFKSADLFVAPHTIGTQSGVLKAALGFGLPAVVTNVITDELIKILPERCLIAPAGNAIALAECIKAGLQLPVENDEEINLRIKKAWKPILSALGENF